MNIWSIILIFICLVAIIVLRYAFVFMLLALLPAIVAFFIDSTPKKKVFNTVLAANLAGTLLPLSPVLSNILNITYGDVGPLINNPLVWLMVYSSAAAGWSLVFFCRYITRVLLSVSYAYRAQSLEKQQAKLIEEWGEDIKKLY